MSSACCQLPVERTDRFMGWESPGGRSGSLRGGIQCERGDLNPHEFPHWILNPARLPVPPLSHHGPCLAPTRRPGRPAYSRPASGISPGAHGVNGDEIRRQYSTASRTLVRSYGARSEGLHHAEHHAIFRRCRMPAALEAAMGDAEIELRGVELPARAQPDDAGARLGHAGLMLLSEPEARGPGIAPVVVLGGELPLGAPPARHAEAVVALGRAAP